MAVVVSELFCEQSPIYGTAGVATAAIQVEEVAAYRGDDRLHGHVSNISWSEAQLMRLNELASA